MQPAEEFVNEFLVFFAEPQTIILDHCHKPRRRVVLPYVLADLAVNCEPFSSRPLILVVNPGQELT